MVLVTLYVITPGSVILFVVSLVRFCRAKKKNKLLPGTYPPEEMRERKDLVIGSALCAGVVVAVMTGFMVLMYRAVAYM